jgi:hypothetical protein
MKWLVILLFPSMCFAKEYHFYYRIDYDGKVNVLEQKLNAPDLAEAIKIGALQCAEFFVEILPPTDYYKWEIFNTCLNPNQK